MPHTHEESGTGCCGGHGHSHANGGSCCEGDEHKAAGGCCKDKAAAAAAVATLKSPADFEALDTMSLVMRYRRGIEAIDRRVFDLTEEQIDTAFLPDAGVGQWPIRVLLGHLADADLVFSHRLRRAVGEDKPVLAVWDENSFIDSMIYGNGPKKYLDPHTEPEASHARVMSALGGPLAVIHTLRQWTGQWLMILTDDQWKRVCLHPERGEQSVKRILSYSTWHLEHHAEFLSKKLDKMVGPAAVEEAGGGCGSGCGCRH